jgi:hypothetical protein
MRTTTRALLLARETVFQASTHTVPQRWLCVHTEYTQQRNHVGGQRCVRATAVVTHCLLVYRRAYQLATLANGAGNTDVQASKDL